MLEQGETHYQLLVGSRTAPGDQVFVQRVGVDGILVVDAERLKLVPRSADEWRETLLLSLKGVTFDRLAVTNGPNMFELQREGTNAPWRLTYPIQARADHAKIEDLLQ